MQMCIRDRNKAVVRETGEVEGTDLVLEGYDKEIAFKYTLSSVSYTHLDVYKRQVLILYINNPPMVKPKIRRFLLQIFS